MYVPSDFTMAGLGAPQYLCEHDRIAMCHGSFRRWLCGMSHVAIARASYSMRDFHNQTCIRNRQETHDATFGTLSSQHLALMWDRSDQVTMLHTAPVKQVVGI